MTDLIKRFDAIKAITEVLFDEPPYFNSIEKCEAFARKTLEDIPSFEPKYEITADQLAKLLREGWTIKEKERTGNKPIRIDGFTEKCPKCGEKVMYAVGTGTMFHGASESYEDWRVIKHDFCPRCGIKIEREGADNE